MEVLLNGALDKLPDYKDVVFRGTILPSSVKALYFQALEHKIAIKEPAFLSTSQSELTAQMFSRADTILRIDSLHGKNIERMAFYGITGVQNEREILFKSETNFQVTGFRDRFGLLEFTLKEIEP